MFQPTQFLASIFKTVTEEIQKGTRPDLYPSFVHRIVELFSGKK